MNRYALTPGLPNGRPHPPRPPLRSLQELADEFGVKACALAQFLARDPRAPTEAIDHRNHRSQCRYFPASEARVWWKTRTP